MKIAAKNTILLVSVEMDLSHLPHHVLKDMGNRSFTEGHYQDALVYYSGAIEKQPNISSYYSNRALCYVQVHEYVKALLDCKYVWGVHFYVYQALGVSNFIDFFLS
ncbi:hypothetical protein PHET_11238 [Paragonimus heterotremus]|uniref:Uncharacterized protein n=1 Tax=Paragonimus heterotremus TaxID=100268 RepID=A0A8J4WDT2_9TREM|nr:hypothetical protein PHET_11238 [Paragonimus heterotremus]